MTPKEYQELSEKTFAYFKDRTLDPHTVDLLHCAIGASTEANELLDAFKKHIYYQKPLDVVNIGEEIADMQWYLFNLCRLLGLNMEDLLENNIKKLKQRYGDKFSEEKAIVRDLDKEREILEEIITGTDYSKTDSDDSHLIIPEVPEVPKEKDRTIKENNGLKPPGVSWDIDDDKKKEILSKLRNNELEGTKAKEISLSDVADTFSFLEKDNFELIRDMKQIQDFHKNLPFNFDEKLKKSKKYEYIFALFKAHSGPKLVGLDFHPIMGTLMCDYVFGGIEGVSLDDKSELQEFLQSQNILYSI